MFQIRKLVRVIRKSTQRREEWMSHASTTIKDSVIMDMLIGMIGDADHGSTSPQCYTQLPRANIRSD